jgi:hypothetical protein
MGFLLYTYQCLFTINNQLLLHLIPFWRKVAGVLLFLEKYKMHESFLERLVSFSYAVLFHNNFGSFGPATFFLLYFDFLVLLHITKQYKYIADRSVVC